MPDLSFDTPPPPERPADLGFGGVSVTARDIEAMAVTMLTEVGIQGLRDYNNVRGVVDTIINRAALDYAPSVQGVITQPYAFTGITDAGSWQAASRQYSEREIDAATQAVENRLAEIAASGRTTPVLDFANPEAMGRASQDTKVAVAALASNPAYVGNIPGVGTHAYGVRPDTTAVPPTSLQLDIAPDAREDIQEATDRVLYDSPSERNDIGRFDVGSRLPENAYGYGNTDATPFSRDPSYGFSDQNVSQGLDPITNGTLLASFMDPNGFSQANVSGGLGGLGRPAMGDVFQAGLPGFSADSPGERGGRFDTRGYQADLLPGMDPNDNQGGSNRFAEGQNPNDNQGGRYQPESFSTGGYMQPGPHDFSQANVSGYGYSENDSQRNPDLRGFGEWQGQWGPSDAISNLADHFGISVEDAAKAIGFDHTPPEYQPESFRTGGYMQPGAAISLAPGIDPNDNQAGSQRFSDSLNPNDLQSGSNRFNDGLSPNDNQAGSQRESTRESAASSLDAEKWGRESPTPWLDSNVFAPMVGGLLGLATPSERGIESLGRTNLSEVFAPDSKSVPEPNLGFRDSLAGAPTVTSTGGPSPVFGVAATAPTDEPVMSDLTGQADATEGKASKETFGASADAQAADAKAEKDTGASFSDASGKDAKAGVPESVGTKATDEPTQPDIIVTPDDAPSAKAEVEAPRGESPKFSDTPLQPNYAPSMTGLATEGNQNFKEDESAPGMTEGRIAPNLENLGLGSVVPPDSVNWGGAASLAGTREVDPATIPGGMISPQYDEQPAQSSWNISLDGATLSPNFNPSFDIGTPGSTDFSTSNVSGGLGFGGVSGFGFSDAFGGPDSGASQISAGNDFSTGGGMQLGNFDFGGGTDVAGGLGGLGGMSLGDFSGDGWGTGDGGVSITESGFAFGGDPEALGGTATADPGTVMGATAEAAPAGMAPSDGPTAMGVALSSDPVATAEAATEAAMNAEGGPNMSGLAAVDAGLQGVGVGPQPGLGMSALGLADPGSAGEPGGMGGGVGNAGEGDGGGPAGSPSGEGGTGPAGGDSGGPSGSGGGNW